MNVMPLIVVNLIHNNRTEYTTFVGVYTLTLKRPMDVDQGCFQMAIHRRADGTRVSSEIELEHIFTGYRDVTCPDPDIHLLTGDSGCIM